MPKGGARPNAGRKPGKREAKTLEKMRVQEAMHQYIMGIADKLFIAQSQLALGSMKVIRVDKTLTSKGEKTEYIHVTEVDEILTVLRELEGLPGTVNGNYYFFEERLPDIRAIDSMNNRAFGKPKETVEIDDKRSPKELAAEIIASLTSEGYSKQEVVAEVIKLYPDAATEISGAIH